jgi:hypothetical protein
MEGNMMIKGKETKGKEDFYLDEGGYCTCHIKDLFKRKSNDIRFIYTFFIKNNIALRFIKRIFYVINILKAGFELLNN